MDLFFVVSSFLISFSLVKELKRFSFWEAWKNFFIKRSLRIFPPFIALLVFTICLTGMTLKAFQSGMDLGVLTQGIESLQRRYANWWVDAFYVSNYFKDRLLIHGWSLSMEEQFYILLPSFLLLYITYFRNTKSKFLFLIFFLVLANLIRLQYYFFHPRIQEFTEYTRILFHPFHTHFDSFIWGILIMELHSLEPTLKSKYLNSKIILGSFGVLFSTYLFFYTTTLETHYLFHIVFKITLFSALAGIYTLLMVEKAIPAFNRFLSFSPFVSIGKLSYTIYLIHMLVSSVVLIRVFDHQNFEFNTISKTILASLYALFYCVVIASFSYFFLEKPFLKLREWSLEKFDPVRNEFYSIAVHPAELKIVAYCLTALSLSPYLIFKYLGKAGVYSPNLFTLQVLNLLVAIPILWNLYSFWKYRKPILQKVLENRFLVQNL